MAIILFCLIVLENSAIKYNKFRINNVVKIEKYDSINFLKKSGWIKIKSDKNDITIKVYRNGEELTSFTNNTLVLTVNEGDVIELKSLFPTTVEILDKSNNIVLPFSHRKAYINEKLSLLCRVEMR